MDRTKLRQPSNNWNKQKTRTWSHSLATNHKTMEENETKQRIKLGAFVAGGVLLFITFAVLIGSANNIFSRTFAVSAVFKNVEGLKEGDKVWLSGVQIGTVKAVKIVTVGEVVVSLSLKEKQNDFIRKNATA